MNKEQALRALAEGHTLTHTGFTPEEWIKQDASHYIFEDGCQCTHDEFWSIRTEDYWDKGWSEYKHG